MVLLGGGGHDPGDPDAVGPHLVEPLACRPRPGTSPPAALSTWFRAGRCGPTTIERPKCRAPPSFGQTVTLADLHEVLVAVHPEVAADVRAASRGRRPRSPPSPSSAPPRTEWSASTVTSSPHALGADEALRVTRAPRSRRPRSGARPSGKKRLRELLLVHLAVAGHEHDDRAARRPRTACTSGSCAGSIPSCSHDRLDRDGARACRPAPSVPARHLRPARAARGGCGLQVGEVVAVLASHEEVLAHVGQRHELVVHVAADRARRRPRRSRTRARIGRRRARTPRTSRR